MKKLILFLTLLFVGLGATFEANAQYSPSNNLNYIKLLKTPPIGSVEDSVMVYDSSSSFVKMLPKSSIVAGKESISNKTSTVSGYSTTLYPNEKATHDALDLKLNISDLPTNLTLYPTTVTSDVSGYVVMVKDIHDVRYNSTAVDVSTPTITGVGQLISQRISDAGVLIGQPGVFNITTFGNIRRLSGSGTATFYFEVYHRDALGVETLICTSSISNAVVNGTYQEFTASGVWDDGEFAPTDRIVIKSYANRIAGGSDPIYQFQFGGSTPVRTLLPVPFSVVDAGYELKANKQNNLTPDGTGTKYPTVDAVNTKVSNIDNTSDANKPVSTATQTALNLKSPIASPTFTGVPAAPTATAGTNTTQIATTAFVTGAVTTATTPDATTLVKGKIQLAGDLAGTAAAPTVPALATKEPTITAGTTAQYWRGDKTFQTLNSTAVGLSNVDNTSDANKPISTATQTGLNTKENVANKNTANGYAGLGSDGKLISSQLPSITISDTFVTASQAAMLALVAETGDVAVRTDLNKSFILKGTNPTVLADWQELLTPTSAVTTVFGRAGAVTAQTGDYTTEQVTETTNKKYQTDVQALYNDANSSIQTQLNGKAPSTGGTGYIQNQNASAQSANMWISGQGLANDAFIVLKNGSNTVGNGGRFSLGNAAGDRFMISQLNASNGMDIWSYNGASYIKASSLSQAGAATFASTVTASNGTLIGGTLTSGYIPKATGANSLGNSGISTDGSGAVDINYNNGLSGGLFQWGGTTVVKSALYGNGNGYFSGNVGIGTTSTTARLTIEGSSAGAAIDINNTSSSLKNRIVTGNVEGALQFENNANTEIARLTQGGNVLIGTTTDNGVDKVQVVGNISNNSRQNIIYSSFNNDAVLFQRNGSYGSVIRIGRLGVSTLASIDYPNSGELGLSTNGAERININASGVVKVSNLAGTGTRMVTADSSGNLATDSTVYAPLASPTLTGTPTAPTATAGTNTTQLATTAFVQGIRPYKVYTALLTQVGTDAPTAIILENTLGGTIVWTRDSAGIYYGTLSGAFSSNKTVCFISGTVLNVHFNCYQNSTSSVTATSTNTSGEGVDTAILSASIEIRVYN